MRIQPLLNQWALNYRQEQQYNKKTKPFLNHWVLGNSDRVRMCRFSKKGVFVPVLQSMDHTSAPINYHTQKTGICFIKNLLVKIILHIVWFYRNYQNKLTIFHQLYENICKIFGMCIDHHPVQKEFFSSDSTQTLKTTSDSLK